MNKITVFLNLGMQGLGTKTFNDVDLNESLDSLLDKVKNREGAIGVEWIRTGTKVLTGTKFGSLTLADLGFYNQITLWASLRLKGGAEQKSQFDATKVTLLILVLITCDNCLHNKYNHKIRYNYLGVL